MVNASCIFLDEISRLAEQIAARFLLLLVASFHDLTNHCWNGILRNHDQERQKKKTDAMRKIERVSCTQTFSFVYTVCQSYPLNHRVKNIYIKKAAYCLIDAVIRDILPNFESSNSGFSFPRENFKSSNPIPPLKRKSSFAWRICCSFPPPVKLTEQQPKHRSEKKKIIIIPTHTSDNVEEHCIFKSHHKSIELWDSVSFRASFDSTFHSRSSTTYSPCPLSSVSGRMRDWAVESFECVRFGQVFD